MARSLLYFPLAVIIVFMIVSTAGGGANFSFTHTADVPVNSSLSVNGTENVVNIPVGSFTFGISATQGAIAVLISVIALGAVVGVRVMGSGILGISAEIIVKGAFYFAMWGIFSVFAQPLIGAIPVFGVIIYLMLTIMYIVGFMQTLLGGVESD